MADELVTQANPIPIVSLEDDGGQLGFLLLEWLVGQAEQVPPYWSRQRDRWLRTFVYDNGALKTAVGTFVNKAVTIPLQIVALDTNQKRDVDMAKIIERRMWKNSGSVSSTVNKGFKNAFKMFIFDYLTQDNGAFMLVLGNGPADGPIVGPAMGLLHLDSHRCTRTKNPEYPVVFSHDDGKRYKIHWTRIIEMANMPSPDMVLNGVGLCPVSCCVEAAQEIWDIYKFSAEKFGSRPPRQILYAETGATVSNIEAAISKWKLKMDNEQRDRFGGTMIAAPRVANQELRLKLLDLSSTPDGFDRRDAVTLDKAEIAAAFGLDLRDLAFSFGISGQTRADAQVQDKKGRGKGVGEFLETFTSLFNSRVLNADRWEARFDNLDDDQDEQKAQIRDIRSMATERDMRSGVTTVRTEREMMLTRGEITENQFENMELEDGRLPNGLDVLLLFQSDDTVFKRFLDLGVDDPTDVMANDPMQMQDDIRVKILEVSKEINVTRNQSMARQARQALAALEKLQSMYVVPDTMAEATAISEQVELEAMDSGASATVVEEESVEDDVEAATEQKANSPPVLKQAEIGDNVVDDILREYESRFSELVELAAENAVPRDRFEELLAELIAEILAMLWLRGANMVNVERSRAETLALQEALEPHLQSVQGFANDIYSGRYEDKPESLLTRMFVWTNMAASVYFAGLLLRRDDPHLRWVWNPLKDHCSDCVRLNGQVHRASEWQASGWRPRSTGLECRGFNCGCALIETIGPSQGNF